MKKRRKVRAGRVLSLKNGTTIQFVGPVEKCPVDREWLSQNTTPLPFPFLVPEPKPN